jgi:flagellar biosynthesis/type III secretory pathway M-ring protein FliF/YscJ
VFEENNPENIVAIRSPSRIKDNDKSGLSPAALAGIVVGVVLLLGLICIICIRKKKKARQDAEEIAEKTLPADVKEEDSDEQQKSPIPENTFEVGEEAKLGELYSERERQEVHTEEHPQELENDGPRQEMFAGEHRPELMGADGDMRHESGAREVMAELPAVPYTRH